jgi:2-polyprenyl-6-hydroxyphenyl methylase / 3-demethylubiquinone-9 3-methyltransferase
MSKSANVDSAELTKFNRLAKLWWDTEGAMGALHTINPLRMQFITKKRQVADLKVLDIGCGGGILTEALAKAGAEASGIDLAETPLEIAKQHAEKTDLTIDYRLQSAEAMAEQHPGEFDVVVCMEMLEHVPDPSKIVQACATLVKPGGQVFFSTINRTLKAYLFAIIGAEYVLKLLPKGTHTYSKLIRPAELVTWAAKSDLQLERTAGFAYQPFTKKFSLRRTANVNYITAFVKQA